LSSICKCHLSRGCVSCSAGGRLICANYFDPFNNQSTTLTAVPDTTLTSFFNPPSPPDDFDFDHHSTVARHGIRTHRTSARTHCRLPETFRSHPAVSATPVPTLPSVPYRIARGAFYLGRSFLKIQKTIMAHAQRRAFPWKTSRPLRPLRLPRPKPLSIPSASSSPSRLQLQSFHVPTPQ
jgi:hypothetical protein